MKRLDLSLALAAAVAAIAGTGGCNDPVHDDAVSALGGEVPGVPPGPLHRPGQPCLVCHDGSGPASLVFGAAGTVFQDQTDPTPLVAATVQLTDATLCAAGESCDSTTLTCAQDPTAISVCSAAMPCPSPQICQPDGCHAPCPLTSTTITSLETNCAGNFFVEAVDWNPVFPVHIQIVYGDQSAQMISHMGRETSCATCHTGTVSPMSVSQVYLDQDPMTYPPSGCQ